MSFVETSANKPTISREARDRIKAFVKQLERLQKEFAVEIGVAPVWRLGQMISPGSIVLTKKERRTAIRLLGLLQAHLESAIESCLLSSSVDMRDPEVQARVTTNRRDRIVVKGLVKKLEAGLRA